MLTKSSESIVATTGQVIENLDLSPPPGVSAIVINGAENVTVRNSRIRHEGATPGVAFSNAPGLLLEYLDIAHVGPAPPTASFSNISGEFSDDIAIGNVRLALGSSGVYLDRCARPALSFLEGANQRGPSPRGQLVQFNTCDSFLLENFSNTNDPLLSSPEDNISCFACTGASIVRLGLLDGNNAPSGVGVMVEGDSPGTFLIEDVDTIRMGNGSFSAFPNDNVTFRRTRARDNICEDQGRGAPLSGAVMWAIKPGVTGVRIEESVFWNTCRADGVVLWARSATDFVEINEIDFALREPLKLVLPWETVKMTLTTDQRREVWAGFQSDLSNKRESLGVTKADLRAALDAIDDWIEANQASFNAALPLPARTALTATQKQRLFMAVARKRFEVA